MPAEPDQPEPSTAIKSVVASKKKPPPPPKKQGLTQTTSEKALTSPSEEVASSLGNLKLTESDAVAKDDLVTTSSTSKPDDRADDSTAAIDHQDELSADESSADEQEAEPELKVQPVGGNSDAESVSSDESVDSEEESVIEGTLVKATVTGNIEDVTLTAVGRIYLENGKRMVVDLAKWKHTEQPELYVDFPVVVEMKEDKKESVSLTSKFLRKAFNKACDRKHFPSISISKEGIVIPEPYAPLYFYWNELLEACAHEELLLEFSHAQPQRDVAALKYWHEQWTSSYHEKVREALKQDSVPFDYLWAVFKPGELLYGRDSFGQERLYVIAATAYRSGFEDMGMPGGDDDESGGILSSILPLIGTFFNLKKRLAIETWSIGWDSATQLFTRKSTVFSVQAFTGLRPVTELEVYPLKYHENGNQEAIDKYLARLEERGKFWKGLVTSTSACLQHNGPAIIMNDESKLLMDPKSETIHVSVWTGQNP
jgi:hypothetical protein